MGQVAASAVLANITAEIQAIRHCICTVDLLWQKAKFSHGKKSAWQKLAQKQPEVAVTQQALRACLDK